jgi:hypothetical protein
MADKIKYPVVVKINVSLGTDSLPLWKRVSTWKYKLLRLELEIVFSLETSIVSLETSCLPLLKNVSSWK